MINRFSRWLAAAALAAAACSSGSDVPTSANQNPDNGLWEGTVEANAADGSVRIKNQTERPIGYLVVEKGTAIVALFPPCTTNCTMLVQGEEVRVTYPDIVGYFSGATEAIVYWWTYGQDGRPEGAMSSVAVRL